MSEPQTQFITVGAGANQRQIAYRATKPPTQGSVTVLWLIGLNSDMASTKAEALATWTAQRGLGFVRFDYSGHGQSSGQFEGATLSDWLEEAEAVFCTLTQGAVVVAGSSTGGHVALLLLRRLMETRPEQAARIKGLALIAPAWDLTEELMWKAFPADVRQTLLTDGKWVRPSAYDPAGYVINLRFIEDGRSHVFGGRNFDPGRPVLILQGALDRDVPLAHAERLCDELTGNWVRMTVVPDGEHRLSRAQDIALFNDMITELISEH